MTPKEISQTFSETFGLDFHNFYDTEEWKTEKSIRLDIWKFEEWFNTRFPNEREQPLYKRIENEYGHKALDFIKEII